MQPLIANDAVVLGLLFTILALIFYTSSLNKVFWKKFYTIFPPLLMCYFIPGLLNSFNVISGDNSKLYFISSRYLLPACLVLLTLNIDFSGLKKLGPKALIMFFVGTIGVVVGGPIALFLFKLMFSNSSYLANADALDQLWRGLSTIAGSWIGGGANQTAMKEIFLVPDSMFSLMVVVDVLVANVWMAILLFLASRSQQIDHKLGADNSSIIELQEKLEKFSIENQKIATQFDLMKIFAIAFAATGLSHFLADFISPLIATHAPFLEKFSLTSSFFWLIFFATLFGIILSLTSLRKLEGVGASKIGNIMLYILVVSIGMKMNIVEVFKYPELFILGLIWIFIHGFILIFAAKLLKAPLFFMAVASQANIGGAASAPVVASAFHPSLSSVGVLLAVLGYGVGTYGAWLSAILMKWVAQ